MSTVSVRYIVDDVDAAIAFYRDRLGFRELMHPDPAFAMLTHGDLRLVLVAPVPAGHPGGGSRPMPGCDREPVFNYGSAPAAAGPTTSSPSPIRLPSPRSRRLSTACASSPTARMAAQPRPARG